MPEPRFLQGDGRKRRHRGPTGQLVQLSRESAETRRAPIAGCGEFAVTQWL